MHRCHWSKYGGNYNYHIKVNYFVSYSNLLLYYIICGIALRLKTYANHSIGFAIFLLHSQQLKLCCLTCRGVRYLDAI